MLVARRTSSDDTSHVACGVFDAIYSVLQIRLLYGYRGGLLECKEIGEELGLREKIREADKKKDKR